MAIKVGINENVQLNVAETKVNDKGTLVINFTQGQSLAAASIDDLLNNAAGVKNGQGTNVMLWGINTEAQGAPREADRIAKDLVSLRDQLEHILQGYMTTDNAKLDPYAGLSLTAANFSTEITKQAVVDKIYKNLTEQFVAKLATLGEAANNKFRLLLVRKSESNHYGTFRRNFITDNPFFEPMSIPAEASAVKFTKYEITKGLNNPNPIAKADVADQVTDETGASDDILGSR